MNIIVIIIQMLATKIPLLQDKWSYFNGERSPFVLALAILLLITFRDLNIKNSKIINSIATTTLGIYLVHENIFLREIIWKQIVRGSAFINPPLLIVNAICGVLFVFIASMLIYIVVEKLIIKNLVKMLSKIYHKVKNTNLYLRIENKLANYYNS